MVKFILTTTAKRALQSMGASSEPEEYIEFETLEQFMEWVNAQKHLCIMGGMVDSENMPIIELYDDYRE